MNLKDLNLRAVASGFFVAVVIALPVGIVAQILADRDTERGPAQGALFLAVLVAFTLGGWVAAKPSRDTPQFHGAVAAFAAFVAIQAIGIVRRVLSGDDINLGSVVFNGLLAASCGLLGGLIARRGHERSGAGTA